MHVLLIEPDKIQAGAISEALRRSGYTVQHVVSAQSAVQSADEQMPDVVILELQLSQHNGVEFLYEFRSYPEWLTVPVVLYTYVPSRELVHAAALHRELGVVHVLHKPRASLAMLCSVIAKVTAVTTL